MRSTVTFYIVSMLLVTALVGVAVLWTHWSHLGRHQGSVLVHLWSTHGLHVFDLCVLALELLLSALLSLVLLAGFSRPR